MNYGSARMSSCVFYTHVGTCTQGYTFKPASREAEWVPALHSTGASALPACGKGLY